MDHLGEDLVKPLDLLFLAPESWRPMEASSGRASNRTSERELDRIPISARCGGVEAPVRLWDYSPFGFAVLAAPGIQGGLPASPGQPIDLCFDLGSQRVTTRCTIENMQAFRGSLRLGLSRKDMAEPPGCEASGSGLQIPGDCHVAAETLNPILYGEWCTLKLIGIQPGLAFAFLSSDPSLILFQGQRLEVELSLPSAGECKVVGRIKSLVRRGETQVLLLDPERLSPVLTSALAEYLAFEAHVSPENLKSLGFPARFMRDRLEFRYAKAQEEFAAVSDLRTQAKRASHPATGGEAPAASHRPNDRFAKLLCAYHEGKLVGAATLAYPGKASGRPLALRHLTVEEYRAWEPDLEQVLEVRGECLHPDYRRGDLLKAFIEQIARAFVLSDRKHILMHCDKEALPRYRMMGFREAGAPYPGPDGPRCLVLLPKEAVTHAKGIDLGAWLALFADLAEDLLDRGLVETDTLTGWKLRALRALRPLLRFHSRRKSGTIFGDLLMRKESQWK
jgi:hypothetical protein